MARSGHTLDTAAAVVILGGGVIGMSTAYHLAAAGVEGVVLLERDAFGSGSTSRAAGGVRAQFSDAINIQLGSRSLRAFERFPQQFGQEIDLHQVGYLFLLNAAEDVDAFERSVRLQNELGVPSRMMSVEEAQSLSPLVAADGLLAAAYSPTDGHCSPESVVLGYAAAARRHGARLLSHCPATGIDQHDQRITAVRTPDGVIETDTVICAAGAWSQDVGAWLGVHLPVVPLRRQVLVTEPISAVDPHTPFTIDFGTSYYFHREGEGLLLGMSDPDETPGFKLQRDDLWLDRFGEVMRRRTPSLVDVGIRSGWAGLYEMTPDHNALIGEDDHVNRFLYATGFSGHGFLMGPAVGEVMRDLYLGHDPVVDVTALSATRFRQAEARRELNVV